MKKLLMLMFLTLSAAIVFAQSVITGTVTDEASGKPLEGVAVIAKGTTSGALSGGDGKFKISVPKGATMLVFSYVGKKTVEVSATGSTVDVQMKDDVLQMDEVVVTALGISRQEKELGYSVQNVSGNSLVNSRETNVVAGMSGKVAGVQVINSGGSPGASAYIRIRGNNSLNGNSQPLFVIDGVPVDNTQNASGNPDDGANQFLANVGNSNRAIDIDPNNVESMTVLKGAAATALYGIRAANGAIIITTKKGASQGKNFEVSYNTSYTADNVNMMPEMQTRYGQGRGGIYRGPDTKSALNFRSWGPLIDTMRYNGDAAYLWDARGQLVGQSASPNGARVTPYDNAGNFFQTGRTWSNSVSVSGGNGESNFRLSVSNLSQTGVVPNSSFGRTSVALAASSAINSKLKVSSSVTYTNSGGNRVQQGSNISGLMLGLLRTPATFDLLNGVEKGDWQNEKAYIIQDGTGDQRTYMGIFQFDNPYWTINKNIMRDNVNRVYGFGQVDYLPTSWLNVMYRLGTDFYSDNQNQHFAINSASYQTGQVYSKTFLYQHINSDLLVTASKKVGDIDARLMLGHNFYNRSNSYNYVQGDGLTVPDFYHMSNATSVLSRYNLDRYRSAAVFVDAQLGYKGWAYLNGTFRRERSSALDGRDFAYGGVNAGVVVTEALGMTDNAVLSFAKIRGNYAVVGNDQGYTYASKNYYTQAVSSDGWTNGLKFPFNGVSAFSQGDVAGNPNLLPEKTAQFEIGADMRFFQNRVGLDFTYYSTTSKDQILAVPIAATSGYLQQVSNAGTMTNKGIEIVLNASPVKTNDFEWNLNLNFTRNRNMVKELAPGIETLNLGGFEGSDIRAVAGQPYGQIYGTRWLRDKAGNLIVDPTTGYPQTDNITGVLGNPNPDFLMGLRNTLTWKGVSMSFLFDWKKGGDIWNGTLNALRSYGTAAQTGFGRRDSVIFGNDMVLINGSSTKPSDSDAGKAIDFYGTQFNNAVYGYQDTDGSVKYTDKDGADVTTPVKNETKARWGESWFRSGLGNGFNGPSEQAVEDGSFLRLRELNISYALSKDLLSRTPISSANITFTARNLWLQTKYNGVDPETSLVGSRNAQGLDYFNMPNTRSYGVALNLTF